MLALTVLWYGMVWYAQAQDDIIPTFYRYQKHSAISSRAVPLLHRW